MGDKTGSLRNATAVRAALIGALVCMCLICGGVSAGDQLPQGLLTHYVYTQALAAEQSGQTQPGEMTAKEQNQAQAHLSVTPEQSITCAQNMLVGAGSATQHFQHLCTALSGKTIALDPGHQAHQNSSLEPVAPGSSTKKMKVTSGTQGVATHIPEHELNLSVAFAMKDRFEQCGAHVVMTRTSADVNISNSERAKIANDAHADLCIHIHADGVDDKTVHGFMTLAPERRGNLSAEAAQRSMDAARLVHAACLKATGAFDRGIIKRGDLTGCNWSEVPVIYLEVGCMTNPTEDELMQTAEYQKKIACGTVEGVADWITSGK